MFFQQLRMTLYITPTEALLQVAKQHPSMAAVNSGGDRWSYAALWARIRQIADKIHNLDDTRNPIGLHMGWVSITLDGCVLIFDLS